MKELCEPADDEGFMPFIPFLERMCAAEVNVLHQVPSTKIFTNKNCHHEVRGTSSDLNSPVLSDDFLLLLTHILGCQERGVSQSEHSRKYCNKYKINNCPPQEGSYSGKNIYFVIVKCV